MRKNTHPQFGYADTQALYNTRGLDVITQEFLETMIMVGKFDQIMNAYKRGECAPLDTRVRDTFTGMSTVKTIPMDVGAKARKVVTDYIEQQPA